MVPVGHAANDDKTVRVCLLQLMQVRAGVNGDTNLTVFRDSGSKVSMITFKKAKELGLNGKTIKINIIKVGADKETIDSRQYDVPIHDRYGNLEYFQAFGINKISTAIESTDVKAVSQLLSVENGCGEEAQG